MLCFSQEPMYWQLTDEDGLPSMTIYDILQDDEGYIWFGTANGVCRYDGSKVTVFDHPDLKDREILDIEKDAWNRIWIVNLSGQVAYVSEGKIHLLDGSPLLLNKELIKLHIEGHSLSILYKGPLNEEYKNLVTYQLNKDDVLIRSSEIDISNIPSPFAMESDQNNNVITIGRTEEKLYINRRDSLFNFSSRQFTILPPYNRKWASPIGDFGIYKDQKILMMTNRSDIGLFQIRDTTMSLMYMFEEPIKVNGVKMTGSNLWLMSTDGIWTTNLDSLTQGPLEINKILEGVNTNNIFLDREGSYWVVTTGKGAIIIPSLSMKEVEIVFNNTPVKEVYSLLAAPKSNRVISGHQEGIVSVHGTEEANQVIDIDRKGRIRDIFRSREGAFYCVTTRGSVVLDSFMQIEYRNSHSASKKLLIDRNDRFWIGASSGVYSSTQLKNYNFQRSDFVFTTRTYALHEDANQH